jgi:hypothetical protein
VRVKPGGWASGDTLTSAQQNQIDINISNSLDKTGQGGGDVITGAVSFSGAGQLTANQAGAIAGTTAYAISASAVGAVRATVAQAIDSNVVAGIQPGVAKGVQSNIADGISANVAAGIQSDVVGGINLNGGTGDWVTYGQTRSATITQPLVPAQLGTGWTMVPLPGSFLTGPGTAAGQLIWLTRMLNGKFNGAILTGATLYISVGLSHSGVPAVMPGFTIYRQKIDGTAGAALPANQTLFSSSPQSFAPPGSGALWFASGNVQSLVTTPNQNNVIDLQTYEYYAVLNDESGANAQSGNLYLGLQLMFTAIANAGLQ